jgi:hypothetical protein
MARPVPAIHALSIDRFAHVGRRYCERSEAIQLGVPEQGLDCFAGCAASQ